VLTKLLVVGAAALIVGVTALVATATAFSGTSERTNWRKLGNIYLGMPLSAVQYEYGPYDPLRSYRINGKTLSLGFDANRVYYIGTDSPAFRTADGYGVGSYIPLGRCVKTKTNPCAHKWRGLTYMPFVLGGGWHAIFTHGKQRVSVLLLVTRGKVRWVAVRTCPKSGYVRITEPSPHQVRCGLPH